MCKCDCEGKCSHVDPVDYTGAEPMEEDEFHLKVAAIPILFMLCRFGGKPIENATDLRERADNFHQKMMEIVEDLESRIDESKKEEAADAI